MHTSPAFGADDFEIGKNHNVQILNPVNQQGRFSWPGMPWDGMFVKDADVEIILVSLKFNKRVFKIRINGKDHWNIQRF